MTKKTIAVIFGGRSAEHDVSIITAHTPIIESLLTMKEYDVWPVYIAKDGSWYSDKSMNDMAFFQSDDFSSKLKKFKKIHISLSNGLELVWPGLTTRSIKIDLVFPAMHGTYGEDGSLMGLLRMANVPFVGCDIFASTLAMDKVLTKQIAYLDGLPVVPYVWFTKYDWSKNKKEFLGEIANLKYPLFVKPVHLGSSIGITKVKNETELGNAIEVALHYDDKVLVEESVENLIEVTLPIIGNENPILSSVERPLNKTDFFDFKEKYMSQGGKKGGGVNNQYSEIPANIDGMLMKKVQDYGLRTYKALGCTGIARIDFLIEGKLGDVYVNEVNTLPGSLYIHNWKQSGVSGVDLITRLINYAYERFNEQKKVNYVFESGILDNFSGSKISPK